MRMAFRSSHQRLSVTALCAKLEMLRSALPHRTVQTFICSCLLFVFVSGSAPSAQDYANLVALQNAGLVPVPSYSNFPPYAPNFNISNPGKGFLPLPADQNATLLALSLYDWSLPSYERIYYVQYWLIDSYNIDELTYQLFYFYDIELSPVPPLFGLSVTSTYQAFVSEVHKNLPMIQLFPSENRILRYALSMVEPTPQMPKTLYQGLCTDSLFCKQIGGSVNISGDDCVSKYFQAGNEITTTVYWSTTKDNAYAQDYLCHNGQPKDYLIHITTKANSAARNITLFAFQGEEFLYPPGVTFSVDSIMDFTTQLNIYLTEK